MTKTVRSRPLQNDQIAKAVAGNPQRLVGIATLPMQAPQLAAAELRRAMGTLALRGAQIGSNVKGRNLDDPALEPLWAVANELGAFIMVHPTAVAGADRLKSYYLVNLIGNPLDTTIAAASLVFGGVIERYPNIKFLMVHGGGFVPYQAGRFNNGWQVRAEPRARLSTPPQAALDRLLFDTIVHGRPALEFLLSTCTADRVVGERLSFRHGDARLCAAGRGIVDCRMGQSDDPGRCGQEGAGSGLDASGPAICREQKQHPAAQQARSPRPG